MRRAKRTFAAIFSVLAVLLLATPVAAARTHAELTAASADFQAGAVESSADLLYLWENPRLETSDFSMHIEAAEVAGREGSATTTKARAPAPGDLPGDLESPPNPNVDVDSEEPQWVDVHLADVALSSFEFEDNFRFILRALHDTHMSGDLGDFTSRHGSQAMVCGGGIADEESASCDGATDSEGYLGFHYETVPGPLVISHSQATSFQVHLEGDFHLQMMGINLGTDDGTALRSKSDTQDRAPEGVLRDETMRMLDLKLTDAKITFWTTDFGGNLDWAGGSQSVSPGGLVKLTDATGFYKDLELDHETVQLATEHTVVLKSAPGDMLGVRVTQEDPTFFATTFASAPEQVAAVGLGVFGLASLVALLAVAALQAVRLRRATMDDVEKALDAGRYPRAARMARSLQRRDPDNEDAAVARAVALSRAGKPHKVVSEISARIEQRKPEDGVLHYILGLAHLDLKDRDIAFIHLQEAVRRTPSLEVDVSERLGRAPRSAARGNDAYA